ncbi:MAG: carboxypeptidase-like regulatory domain-containing protein [Bacteroidia bacterium]|nr:carboxypeptidase-like regulatory domain-containing protein [Bacteroidia bacterium]
MSKKLYLTVVLVFASVVAFGQANFGEIRGKVIDKSTKKPLDYAEIVVKKEGIGKGGGLSDELGNYTIKPLEPGEYVVEVTYVGYNTRQIGGVVVTGNNISYLNVELAPAAGGEKLKVVTVTRYKTNIIEPDKNQKSFSDKDLVKMAVRSAGGLAATSSAANTTASGGVSFLGQRTDATRVFIDGVPVIGSAALPQGAQSQVDIIQSGVPAQYGDFTGGAINYTTKGPSRYFRKSFEVISSSLFDPYHYNYAQGFMSGPLWVKNRGGGDKEYVALGFQLSGDLNYSKDPSPLYGGVYVVKDDVLAELEQNPLAPNPQGSGFVPASSFLTEDDLVLEKARRNVDFMRGSLQAKLEYQPNKNSTITLFGSGNYQNSNSYSRAQYLLNYKNNAESINQTYRTYLKFTQRLRSTSPDDKENESKSLISDAFYTVRVDYQTSISSTKHATHGDNIFDYGYVGAFNHYRTPFYRFNTNEKKFIDQNGDTVTRRGFFELGGYTDTLLTYKASDLNPERARYTTNFFDNADALGQRVFADGQVFEGLGVINGFSIQNTYSLFLNPGTNASGFSKSQAERFSAYAMGEASLNLKNKHDLQFGMTYEQNLYSGYSLNANGLWTLMPQLANSHVLELDNFETGEYTVGGIHKYDENGVFLDTVTYNTFIDTDAQKTFDRNLRNKLIAEGRTDVYGNPITESSFIDVNSLSPDDLSLDMFSADDLWNNGNSYVSYYGYDHLGNRDRVRPSLAEFLYDTENRRVGSFAPIYSAAWLQDKFAFKDLIFRLGVRIERYDANQFVLDDPYSLYPVQTAGEVSSLQGRDITHPTSIGDDYAVYVNNSEAPSEILGYRKDNTWYDADGIQISTPDLIANETGGQVQPMLVDGQNQEIVRESFRDYDPQVNVLPRVWFSFPINSEAQFFANYDVMAQRPTNGATFTPINQYYFLEASQSRTIANSNMRPRVRTNYEMGFKQKLSDNSAISLIAQYAETRNDFGLVRLYQAYPVTYNTYSNIDFSTTKSFRAEYELRGEGRVSLSANYALLFADGTGSNINSQSALIAANQPNLRSLYPLDVDVRHKIVGILDYRFRGKNDYTGPVWFGKKIFQDFGANFIISGKSGAPYSKQGIAISSAQSDLGRVQRSFLDGNPFGSRLPWQFKVDMNASKTFVVKKKNQKQFRPGSKQYTVFLWVQNLLNNRIVESVYGYTGLPNDDGYLNSPQGQQYIEEQINQQSFMDLYNIKMNNPANFAIPRLARLGFRMNF